MQFSLRDKLVKAGVTNEEEIREHLSRAFTAISFAPHLRVRDYVIKK